MTLNKQVVVISGKQGSGKSTLAGLLTQGLLKMGFNPITVKFADPLYAIHDAAKPALQLYGLFPPGASKDGDFLQVIGTEYGRNKRGQNVWVSIAQFRVQNYIKDPGAVVLVDDARFENEVDALREMALTVRLDCAEEVRKKRCSYWREDTQHPSEVGLDAYAAAGKFDMTIKSDTAEAVMSARMVIEKLLLQG